MRKNEDSRIFQYFFFLQNIDFPDMKDFKMIIFWRYLSVYVSTRLLFSIRLLHVILDIYLLGLVVLIKNGAFSRHSIALKEIHFPLIILDTLEWICIKSPPYDTLPLYHAYMILIHSVTIFLKFVRSLLLLIFLNDFYWQCRKLHL